jgi:hypothetical protein
MFTRRRWLMQLGGGVVLAGWAGSDLDAAELPPGVYEPSREHLGHALAGHPVAPGGQTELVELRAAVFLGETPETPVVREIAQWIDLTVSEASAVRAAALALSPQDRTLAMHYYGAGAMRKIEEFDAQKFVREGLAWLDSASRRQHGRAFNSAGPAEQLAIVENLADNRPDRASRNPGTLFFAYLKERVIHGFYTSRAGLDELGYRGNAFYASPPGCEHLYG